MKSWGSKPVRQAVEPSPFPNAVFFYFAQGICHHGKIFVSVLECLAHDYRDIVSSSYLECNRCSVSMELMIKVHIVKAMVLLVVMYGCESGP